jgi:sterol desaturase/sphingolipid hydroxylase (fatty acid hydroxylase superfamily)
VAIDLIWQGILTLVCGYFVIQLSGYWVHRSLHHPVLRRAHRAHAHHHLVLYPPDKLLQSSYISPPWYDLPIFYYLPASLCLVGLAFYLLPMFLALLLVGELMLLGWLNDYLHAAQHIEGHWLERFHWFQVSRQRHFLHHFDEHKNFGIFSWESDQLFRTYQRK